MKKILIFLAIFPLTAHAYPDTERLGTSGVSPPYSFGISGTVTGAVFKDDSTLIISYGEILKIINLATYSAAASQPPALTSDAGTDGNIESIAYSSDHDRVYAPQDDGDCLVFDMASITDDPTSVTIADGNQLGAIAIDNNGRRAYIVNTTNHTVSVLNLTTLTVSEVVTLTIPSISTFNINAAVHVESTDEIYFATDKGSVFYLPAGGTQATEIIVDAAHTANLSSLAATPNGSNVYVTNETNSRLVKIDTSTHSVVNSSIDISANTSPSDIVITDVVRPQGGSGNAVYAFVSGSNGLTVLNTSGDDVLDLGTDEDVLDEPLALSTSPARVLASSVDDGYVYTINSTQTVGIVSANPWITISSLTYSNGESQMGVGDSVTIAFQADETGTAVISSGGDVTGTGTALTDTAGAGSWSVGTADTDVSVQINYDDNSGAFIEGDNTIYLFVTDTNGDRGRIATSITVDTPPPAVTIESTGFGNSRIYVTFDRMDLADMNHYNIYVDTDASAVLTKSEIAKQATQASSGSTQEAEITGLANSTVYYIAIEAVDNNGNVSASRTNTLANGTAASATPQRTAGPAGFSGEAGCSLIPDMLSSRHHETLLALGLSIVVAIIGTIKTVTKKKLKRKHKVFFLCFLAILLPLTAWGRDPSPKWWTTEVKTGFWMPSSDAVNHFFENCCNLITRVEGGLLVHGRYGAEGGVGFLMKNGSAAGTISGTTSRDRFNFLIIPMQTSFAWRLNYWNWDYVVPYIKTGFDYVYFRENIRGDVTKGLKLGMHGGGGAQINMKFIDEGEIKGLDNDFGINDLFLTLETEYQYINNFGSDGLDLSGPVFSIGLLFEF